MTTTKHAGTNARYTPGSHPAEGTPGSSGQPDVVNVRVEFTLYGSKSAVAADYATALTAIDALATARNWNWYKTS